LPAGPRDAVHHQLFGQTRGSVSGVYLRAGLAQQAQHLLVVDHDAGVSQDRETGILDRFDLLLGEHFQSRYPCHGRLP
jgi:hypothetical protein